VEFASWLATFFDELLGSVRVEVKWAASHLPEQFPQAVLQLVTTFFSRIEKPFRTRTEAALESGQYSPAAFHTQSPKDDLREKIRKGKYLTGKGALCGSRIYKEPCDTGSCISPFRS